MILSMSGQAWLFLSTVAAGFAIGVIYDIFRILRKVIPHRNWAVQVEDVLYWVACSVLVFYFMLHRNYGEIRFFAIMGVALGMLVYFLSISFSVIKVSVTVIEFLKKAVTTAARILLTPVRKMIRLFERLVLPPSKRLARGVRKKTGQVKRGSAARLQKLRRNTKILKKV